MIRILIINQKIESKQFEIQFDINKEKINIQIFCILNIRIVNIILRGIKIIIEEKINVLKERRMFNGKSAY